MGAPAPPEVEEVTSREGLEALRPAWEDLWRRTPGANPFQAPAWLIPWWRAFGRGRLLTLAVREEGRLAGLTPFYVLEAEGCRKLLPLGIGVSDRLDPLLAPAHGDLILRRLAEHREAFDRIDLADLASDSPLLVAPAPAGWRDERRACEPRPVLVLPERPEGLREAVPRLRKLAYYRRRVARLGDVVLETATAASLHEHLEALFRLHGLRWAGRGEPGVLADPAVRAFHRLAAPELLAAGLLRSRALRVDGRIVAVLHGLADGRCFHAYLAGHDPSLPHPGLGALMIGHAIERATGEGLREFDFLRGREPYKYAWGAIDRPAFGRSLWPGS